MKEALVLLGNAVHQLQKERGSVALYLGNHERNIVTNTREDSPPAIDTESSTKQTKALSEKLIQQFSCTDTAFTRLNEAFSRWEKSQSIKALYTLRCRLTQASQLSQQRTAISNSDCPAHQTIHFYTYEMIAPLLEIMVEIALFDDENDSRNVGAYSNFLQWKERIGRERATGAFYLSRQAVDGATFINELTTLITEQESYQKTFLALASPTQRTCLGNSKESDCAAGINALHEKLHHLGKDQYADIITADDWYSLLTHRIDYLHQVEQQLINTLKDTKTSNRRTGSNADTHDTTVFPLERQASQHIAFITHLPFFKDLPAPSLNQLLQSAHIREYKKGKVLFLENEQPTRFYVILQGWVKLYKSHKTGKEAILQMLSGGDTIVDSAVFLNTPYPISAQIAKPATLLSFPGSMVRQLIRHNNELAINMLSHLSQRSQLLIQQVKTTRLKSTTERVGWFLLKTLMDQREHRSYDKNNITLPYDKAMIASYLDMKPETFSRTLKRFKNKGFAIDNDTIILPSASALCGYCDTDIANDCSRYHTNNCPKLH